MSARYSEMPSLLVLSISLICSSGAVAQRTPGPHIIPIDYEALYAMPAPPTYEPFDVYGLFLVSVAAQETPLVLNPAAQVPDSVEQTTDIVFNTVDNEQLTLDLYWQRQDTTPNPLILIIHGGYWKTGDKSVHMRER